MVKIQITMKKRNPDEIINFEVRKIRSIYQETDALKKFWEERYAKTYRDLLETRNEIGRHGVMVEYITKVIKHGSVLDVGCGTGILAELLNPALFDYTGIDISEEAISLAQNKLPAMKNRFLNIRFEEYQPDTQFDVIIANESIYYMDMDLFFRHCHQKIKENGHLIVSVYDFKKGKTLLSSIKAKMENPFEISVINPEADLKWNVLAGILIS